MAIRSFGQSKTGELASRLGFCCVLIPCKNIATTTFQIILAVFICISTIYQECYEKFESELLIKTKNIHAITISM